jgi:hypothetical protein
MKTKEKNGKVSPSLQAKTEALQKKSVGKVWSREITRRIVKVTPVMAAHILEKNDQNRAIRQDHVDRLARDMKHGRWMINGETIKFTKDGKLLDGQHRLYAVLLSDETIDFEFVEGLPDDAMATIDTGRARGMQDVLKIGGHQYASEIAAVLRWWYNYEKKGISFKRSVSHRELLEVLERRDELNTLVPESITYSRAKRLLTPGIWGFVYSGAMATSPTMAKQFAEALDGGTGLTKGSPVLTLRERMAAHQASRVKMPPVMMAAFAIKAWNAFYSGRQLSVLKWIEGEGFPEFATAKGKK